MKKDNKQKSSKPPKQVNFWGAQKEIDSMLENLSLLVDSGVGIQSSLESMKNETSSKKLKQVISRVAEDVDNGKPLWKSFRDNGLLSAHLLALVKSGEESGQLAENLKLIASQSHRDMQFRSRLKSAMIYPIIVVVAALFVGGGVGIFVLPRLAKVFDQLDIDLPLATRILIDIGGYLENNTLLVVSVSLVLFVLFIIFATSSSKFKSLLMAFSSKLPGLNQLSKEIELSRMGYIMGGLLEAGIPINECLESLKDSTQRKKYKLLYEAMHDGINQGKTFQQVLKNHEDSQSLLPSSVQEIIIAGEKSGNLPLALSKVGKRYEDKVEITSKNLANILEPILLIVVAIMVAAIAFAIILPIYSLVGNFG